MKTTRPCILVIDDDHDTRVSLRDSLELRDYCVCSAANGRDALEQLRTDKLRPSLILLDLMMPLMNGWDFLNALRADPELRQIPVLIISASINEQTVTGVNGFVPKPLNFSMILDLVARHRLQPTY